MSLWILNESICRYSREYLVLQKRGSAFRKSNMYEWFSSRVHIKNSPLARPLGTSRAAGLLTAKSSDVPRAINPKPAVSQALKPGQLEKSRVPFLGKVLVSPFLDDSTFVQNIHVVTCLHRRQPMGNDNNRSAPLQLSEAFLDERFRMRIQGTHGFIQNEDLRFFEQLPGDADLLSLSSGDCASPIP